MINRKMTRVIEGNSRAFPVKRRGNKRKKETFIYERNIDKKLKATWESSH